MNGRHGLARLLDDVHRSRHAYQNQGEDQEADRTGIAGVGEHLDPSRAPVHANFSEAIRVDHKDEGDMIEEDSPVLAPNHGVELEAVVRYSAPYHWFSSQG